MRLIDADDFREYCKKIACEEKDNKVRVSWSFAYEIFRDEINERPTIDASTVVRCKDCKWFEDVEDYCLCTHPDYGRYTQTNGFCECGQKMEKSETVG